MTERGEHRAIVLASGSETRRRMLESAGITFDVVTASVDEDEIQSRLLDEEPTISHGGIAAGLARAKALSVARHHPEALVIGADQILSFGREIYSKPRSRAEAALMLLALRGRTHELISSVAVARSDTVVFEASATTMMTMRSFSQSFLETYLDAEGDALLLSAGAYRIEGLGAQLFDRIEGDFFNILGLPLLPLLAELRRQGALRT